jgi:hypothetical protein
MLKMLGIRRGKRKRKRKRKRKNEDDVLEHQGVWEGC